MPKKLTFIRIPYRQNKHLWGHFADIMRPGIKECDEKTKKDEAVVIIDEKHNKLIAVGIALYSGNDILKMKAGKVIKNIHWVGDEIWGY